MRQENYRKEDLLNNMTTKHKVPLLVKLGDFFKSVGQNRNDEKKYINDSL